MNNGLMSFVMHFNEVTRECQAFCCMARGKEFQQEAAEKLRALTDQTKLLKEKAIAIEDEDSANLLLSLSHIAKALIAELSMWLSLKEDDPNAAWSHLVSAQGHAATSIRAHPSASHIQSYADQLRLMETVLFPPQHFNSIGCIIKESRCSICGQEYADCDHMKGKPYMGKMCSREILDAHITEVSLVTEPANRDCRITSVSDDDGNMRDVMTWRLTPREKGEKSVTSGVAK